MAVNFVTHRTTSLMIGDTMLNSLRRTQLDMQNAQIAMSTGQYINKPSDGSDKTSAILTLNQRLAQRTQLEKNLSMATTVLNNTDAALSDIGSILVEAKTIGSSQIGIGSNTDTRQNQATVIEQQLNSMLDICNRTVNGVSLLGGSYIPATGESVFSTLLGGVVYNGTDDYLTYDLDMADSLPVNTNGQASIGATSARIYGTVDLDPQATASTKLTDVNGTQGIGIRQGVMQVTVDGTPVTVDLTSAKTMGDVVTRINAAIEGVSSGSGSLAIAGQGFSLTAAAGHTIDISDIASGKTASDLGIAGLSASGGTVAGASVDPKLTLLTDLSALGTSIDWTSGLKVTQGSKTVTIDFSTATRVQDLVNLVEQAGVGLSLEINADGTGLNLIDRVSGLELSVGEVSGGTTATDLGLRSLAQTSQLSSLNHGFGVSNVQGKDDFSITLHDGTSFNVNIDGATTMGEVIQKIHDAAEAVLGVGAVGTTGDVGTQFNVGLATDGNGLVLQDNTSGTSYFQVAQMNGSLSATDLGIYQNVSGASEINGGDVGKLRVESALTHLMMLRDALATDDSTGITIATSLLETDQLTVTRARADVGVRSQRVENQLTRSAEQKIAEKSMLSELQDADVAEVITAFTQLTQQMQATMKMGAQNLQMTLFQFLG